MILLDIAPWPDERQGRVIIDTIDTIIGPIEQYADPANQGGGGNTPTLLWTILMVLASIGICLLMVHLYRKRRLVAGV